MGETLSPFDVFEDFRLYIINLGWRAPKHEWVIEAPSEKCFYVIRNYTHPVPTHVVEREVSYLTSKLGPNDYALIIVTPSTTGPAEMLIAKHSDKIALFELNFLERRFSRLNRTKSIIIKEFSQWLMKTYNIKFEEITWPFREASPSAPKPEAIVEKKPLDIVGEPINFRGFVYAPLNEAGVILLFSKVMDDLGIVYESSPPTYPDMVARRKTDKGYERVYIEFEYKSSNFLVHKHDPSKCDIIVCWEHDWPDCPLEVIELRNVIRKLPP